MEMSWLDLSLLGGVSQLMLLGLLSSSLFFLPFSELVSLWEHQLGTHLPKN
jgi:hypothetical protein